MCDKNCKDPLCKGQIGFYKFVAGPLMNELHTFFPQLEENAQQFAQNNREFEEAAVQQADSLIASLNSQINAAYEKKVQKSQMMI